MDKQVLLQVTSAGKSLRTEITLEGLLTSVYSRVSVQVTFLGEGHVAAFLCANEWFIIVVNLLVLLQSRLLRKRLVTNRALVVSSRIICSMRSLVLQ